MNPAAVEWLESLGPEEHIKSFCPVYPFDGEMFSLKEDHEGCRMCREAGELLVIG